MLSTRVRGSAAPTSDATNPVRIFLCLLSVLLFSAIPAHAAAAAQTVTADQNQAVIAAIIAADEERIAATSAADPARLRAIFSDELRYAHSSGKVDHKASTIELLVSRQTVYQHFDYKERNILPAAPGIALMSGRVIVALLVDQKPVNIDLNYLAVWRLEQGKWRFLAWQSCRNPAPVAPTAKP